MPRNKSDLSQNSRASKRNKQRRRCLEAKETFEQREIRLAELRQRNAQSYLAFCISETPEHREARLKELRKRKAQQRASETSEEREIRLAKSRKQKAKLRASHTADQRKIHLKESRERTAQRRASETPEHREIRLAKCREQKARRRAAKTNHQDLVQYRPALSSRLQDQESYLDSKQSILGVDPLYVRTVGELNILAVVETVTSPTELVIPDRMETAEVTPDVTIKNEIDIEEEELIRVKTEIPQPENESNALIPVNVNPFDSIQITVKHELNSEHKENLLIERDDISDKPTIIQEVPAFNARSNINVNIKEETDESIVTYDYPNFDDAGSMDSSEAEALGNVETCLQDDVNVKTENGGHLEDSHENQLLNTEVKMEHEIIPEPNSSTQIVPDVPDTPKYSFVMEIPGDVMSNIDQIGTSCLASGDADKVDCATHTDGESPNDVDMKTDKESLNYTTAQTSLLEESDKSEMFNLNPFQLNSITGDVLSLEQEAYNMLKPDKNIKCPKCPKTYTSKYSLKSHLRVHQTIENYRNGVKRGRETKKKNAFQKKKLLQKHDSQDSCSNHEEIKVESKEGYNCTCGKTFQRKTRMESCLRSHDCLESEKYYCMTCLKDFKSKDELALHRKRLHRKKFPCKFCPTDYATRKKLFRHLQIHQKVHQMEYRVIEEVVKGKKKLRCFLCSRFYEEISELKIHVMTEHKGPYSCPHCKNTFPKIIDFGNHTKTYHPEVGGQKVLDVLEAFSRLTQEWKCDECGLQFLEADKLALHQVELHSPELKCEQQFQCPDCRRVFVSQKGLTSHRRIHHSIETGEQAKVEVTGIMCLECRKMCKDMTTLTSHMRFHSPDRKYPCKFCDFRFATPEKRKTHAEIHTGEMKYLCFICEYQCSSENRLKKHKQSLKHANMSEYLLTGKPLLEESTSEVKKEKEGKKRNYSKDSVSSVSNSDGELVSCDVCGEKFPSETEMLQHKETHPFIEIPSADKPTRIFFK